MPEYVHQTGITSSEHPEASHTRIILFGIADAFPKKQAVPLPTATPTFTTIPGLLRNTKKELPQPCCNSRGVPLQCLPATDFPAPPSNREQPSPPIQAQLQEPPPLLHDNSAALQKTPHWSSPSALDPWDSTPTHTPACFAYLPLIQTKISLHTPRDQEKDMFTYKKLYMQQAREAASLRAARNKAHTHLTPSPDPLTTLPPGRLPSGPAPPLRPLPTPATPPPRQLPPPTTTPGPLHYVADAPPTASPIAPSPAATPEAGPQTPAPTHPESMQTLQRHHPRGPDAPTPSLNPEDEPSVMNGGMGDNSRRIPVHPEAASLANQSSLRLAASSSAHNTSPSGTCPHPSTSPTTAPPSASDAPASPAPLMLAPLPHTPRYFFPAPLPLSPSTPRHGPPSPVGAHPPILPGTPGVGEKGKDSRGPANGSRPRSFLLGPTPEGGEARRFPQITAEDAPFPQPLRKSPAFSADRPMLPSFGSVGQNLVRFGTPGKSTTTTTDNSTKAPSIILRKQVDTTYDSGP
ncbi:hypothetical protein E4T56_gene7302 [Termitomyces sp. T112]|nr:hypothetical protein E4T56_gene7302 [Termitomyces sp. T112]